MIAPSRSLARPLSAAIAAILSLAAVSAAQAGPTGGVVTGGAANGTISTPTGNETRIDQSAASITINWDSFDIGQTERVTFAQPSATAVALNLIGGANPSQILGTLDANGRVFLLNPNGIIFGSTAQINVGSLVASSLDLTSFDEATGQYSFSTTANRSGVVANDGGTLTAADGGSITLLGGWIRNSGLITANLGTVNLGTGRAATLNFDADGLVRFQIDSGLLTDQSGVSAAIDNAGTIEAGRVLLTTQQANDVVASAVRNSGVIRATSIDTSGGRIRLMGSTGGVVNTGTLDASSDVSMTGGSLSLGGTVTAGDTASFTATTGSITQSAALEVAGDAAFTAATGQSITLDDTDNRFTGTVSFASGDTGHLQDVSIFDTTALDLRTLAIDGNLTVDANALTQSGTLNVGGNASLTARTGSIAQSAAMEVGGDATITARAGSITQSAALSVQGNSSFTAADGQSITLGDADNTFTGTVSFAAGGTGNLQNVSVRDTTALDLQAMTLDGNLTVNASEFTQSGVLSVGGDASLTARTGAIVQSMAMDVGGNAIFAAQGGSITQAAALTVQGNSSFTAAAGQSIDLSHPDNAFTGTVRFASAGSGGLRDVSIFDTTTLDLQALALDGNLTVSASELTQSGALTVGGDANLTARTGSISLSDTMEVGGAATFVAQAGAITQSAALGVQGNSSFTAAAGQSIELGNSDNDFAGTVSFIAVGGGPLQDVTVADTSALDLQALTLAGNLDATGSTITQSGALNVAGNADLAATAGNITQSMAIGVGGNASFTARGGTITQSAALQVTGDATFAAAEGQSITLDDGANAFGGAVAFASSDTGKLRDVSIRAGGALGLASLALDGNLDAVAGSAITQSAAWNVGGSVNLKTLNDAGAAITVGDDANRFGSISAAVRNAGDTANAAGDILIREADDTVIGNTSTGDAHSVSIESGGSITTQAAASIAAGTLSLTAAGDIGSSGAAVAWTAPSGTLRATSGGNINIEGTAEIALEQVAAGGAGNIKVVSAGTQRVADVRAGGKVELTSTGGSILDDGIDGAGSRLVASEATLQATGSIGEASGVGNGALDLQVGTVTAQAQGGDVYLVADSGDLNLGQVTASGAVSLRASNGSIVDVPGAAVAASVTSTGDGAVQLQALNDIGTVTDVATRQGSAILVDTNGALSAQVASATGQINLAIANDSHPTAGAGAISAGGSGRLLVQSSGDLSLDAFNLAITGFTDAGFSADGVLSIPAVQSDWLAGTPAILLLRGATDVVQSGTGRNFNLGANHLVFESGGQGGAVTLDTSVDRLDASLGQGDLTVVEADDIVLGAIHVAGDASIRAATIGDDGDTGGVTRVIAGNSLTLQAASDIGSADGTGGGRIDTTSKVLSLHAKSGSAFISHQGNVRVNGEVSGVTDVAAPSGSITVDTLRSVGALTLTAGSDASGGSPATRGNITLAGLAQTDGRASLSALGGGSITDADDVGPHLVAADTALTATAMGSQSNALNVDVGLLNGVATQGLYIDTAGAVRIGAVTANTVAIQAAGAMTDDGDARTRISGGNVTLAGSTLGAAGAGNAIGTAADSLTATAAAGGVYIDERDDVTLRSVSAAGADNDIVITAAGALADDGDGNTRISGGNLTLTAAAIGGMDANAALDTAVSSLTATSDTNLSIREMDDLRLNAVTAGGDVAIVAGGALIDDGDTATRVSGIDVTLAATRIGASNERIGTAASVLGANAIDGGIHVDEFDAVTLSDVRSSGTDNGVDLRTAHNGNIEVRTLITQGGAVNLLAGGTGSLTITGTLESNNGVVNLTSGNALAVPGLDTGAGSVILRTVHDLNVGDINASSVSITSESGNVALGRVNAGSGTVSVTANQGSITDATSTSLIAGDATLTALSIGSDDNPLDVAVNTLTANASAGGVFISDSDGLSVLGIDAAGAVNLLTSGALAQSGAIVSGGHAIAVVADSIDMLASATTLSSGADIVYVAKRGDITLGALDAGGGRILAIAANSVYSALDPTLTIDNLVGSEVEVRAGGLGGLGQIGTVDRPLAITTPARVGRSVYLIVPAINGIQTTVPQVKFTGAASALLLKGYSGTDGALLFDRSSAFTPDTVLGGGESIVPLLNGRVAVNTDSLSAAKQALSSGVVTRVNVDWAAFDPDVTLFSTVDAALRLPDDQLDEPVPEARLFPSGTVPPMLRL